MIKKKHKRESYEEMAQRLENDKIYEDLVKFCSDIVIKSINDSLQRFEWGGYSYFEARLGVMFVLAGVFAKLDYKSTLSSETIAKMIKQRQHEFD